MLKVAVLGAQTLLGRELVQVLDHHQYSPYGYYFIVPEARQHDASVVRFRNWLRTRRSDGEIPPP